MKRRNFLKFLAGLPALALFPWADRESEIRFVSLLDARFQEIYERHGIEFDPDGGEHLHLDWRWVTTAYL